jgi:hypothetical protein
MKRIRAGLCISEANLSPIPRLKKLEHLVPSFARRSKPAFRVEPSESFCWRDGIFSAYVSGTPKRGTRVKEIYSMRKKQADPAQK